VGQIDRSILFPEEFAKLRTQSKDLYGDLLYNLWKQHVLYEGGSRAGVAPEPPWHLVFREEPRILKTYVRMVYETLIGIYKLKFPMTGFNSDTGIFCDEIFNYVRTIGEPETRRKFLTRYLQHVRKRCLLPPLVPQKLSRLYSSGYGKGLRSEYLKNGTNSNLSTQDYALLYTAPLDLLVDVMSNANNKQEVIDFINQYRE